MLSSHSSIVAVPVFVLFLFLSSSVFCQSETKKPVTEADYRLWGTLYEHEVSANGAWVTAYMHYEESPDTLHINQVKGKKTHKIVAPGEGRFFGEHKYVVMDQANTLQLIDLETGGQQKISDVQSFAVSQQYPFLVTLEKASDEPVVCIRNYKGQVVQTLQGFTSFQMSPSASAMVVLGTNVGESQVLLVHFGKQLEKKLVVEERLVQFSQPVWSSSDTSFAFVSKSASTAEASICFYSLPSEQLDTFSSEDSQFPAGYSLNTAYVNLSVSPDNQRVIFDLHKNQVEDTAHGIVEVWGGRDPVLYPKSKKLAKEEHMIRFGVWHPHQDTFKLFTTDQRPFHRINPTMDIALTYSMSDKAPQYTMSMNVDYYVTNLDSGEEQLLVSNQTIASNFSGFSPNGNYFAAYKDNKWLLYDLKQQKCVNQFQTTFTDWIYSKYGDQGIYGIAGWGIGNDCIYLHDSYDVWRVPFDVSKPSRLTSGREQAKAYRLEHFTKDVSANLSGTVAVDLTQELLFSVKGDDAISGYYLRKPNGTFEKMVENHYLHKAIAKATHAPVYVYQTQHYSHPPALQSYHSKTKQLSTVFQSNLHHYRYLWGKQETIYYTTNQNKQLKGLLYYPASYDATKQYPMVVSIYEELYFRKNHYFKPSYYNGDGFNVANLTSQGYFVLLPDIVYDIGNPGLSATDCVVAATNAVIQMGIVAPNKIALMGHSFGGYETNFIITQTSLFTTAISGASVFDLPSWYLSDSKSSGNPEIWRFESQQWRMHKSLYEDRAGYARNSPSSWVENVTTPLLLWTGEFDTQINPNQSVAYYLALQRLKKEHALLVYNDEDHSLLQKNSQKDLYIRINDWLSYYLKNQPPKPWMHGSI